MGFDEFAHWALKTSLGFGEAAIGNTAVSFAATLTSEQQARYDGHQYKSVQQKEAEEAQALLEAGISGAKSQMAKNAAEKQAAMDMLKVIKPGDRSHGRKSWALALLTRRAVLVHRMLDAVGMGRRRKGRVPRRIHSHRLNSSRSLSLVPLSLLTLQRLARGRMRAVGQSTGMSTGQRTGRVTCVSAKV